MERFRYTAHGLTDVQSDESKPHFKTASVTSEIEKVINRMGLVRVAGNAYRCKSTKDFWKLDGDKLKRITADGEVDNGESIQAAPADAPGSFLSSILADLTF